MSVRIGLALVVSSFGCSGSSSGPTPAPTSTASSTIGAACSGPSGCAGNLFCYSGDTPQLDGLCSVECTASATSDSCKDIDPNTSCLVAGVCARDCGNGETCPSGTYCNTNDGICEVQTGPAGISDNDSGASAASLDAIGTDSTGTTMMTFAGAATSESMAGVFCKEYSTTVETTLEIFGSNANAQSSAEIKLYNFDLSTGESRQETFTPTDSSVDISASLIGTSTAFMYIQGTGLNSGSCTTTITTLTSDAVAGTFVCDPLPPDIANASGASLSLTFSCPLQ